jgi:hypothetical protein
MNNSTVNLVWRSLVLNGFSKVWPLCLDDLADAPGPLLRGRVDLAIFHGLEGLGRDLQVTFNFLGLKSLVEDGGLVVFVSCIERSEEVFLGRSIVC